MPRRQSGAVGSFAGAVSLMYTSRSEDHNMDGHCAKNTTTTTNEIEDEHE